MISYHRHHPNCLYYCINALIHSVFFLERNPKFTKSHTNVVSHSYPLSSLLLFFFHPLSFYCDTRHFLSVSFTLLSFAVICQTPKRNTTARLGRYMKNSHGTVAVIVFYILKPKLMKKKRTKNNEAEKKKHKGKKGKGKGGRAEKRRPQKTPKPLLLSL